MTVTVEPGAGPGRCSRSAARACRGGPRQPRAAARDEERISTLVRPRLAAGAWCLVLRWLVSWNDDVKTLKSSWFRNG